MREGECGGVRGEQNKTTQSTAYLSQLVVDHHIVRFDITMHDSHTVTVVQSLTHTHIHTNIKGIKVLLFLVNRTDFQDSISKLTSFL